MRHAEQMRQIGVALRLRQHALARIDQHDRQIGRTRARDHVARVLLVSRRVGNDELALRCGEIAVGNVDGDALLALGKQTVGQKRKVDAALAAFF